MDEINEVAIQQKLAAMFAANDDKVTIPKIYIDIMGDIEAAAVMDEIMFWTLPKKSTGKTSLRVKKDGKLWLAVRRADWWDRKRLTERQADRAIEKLVNAGMVEKQVWNFNGKPTVHLRLNMAAFTKAYTTELKNSLADTEDQDVLQDINDLYQMMGFPPSPNGNLPNGEAPSPNGEAPSPNGEFINSLHTASTKASVGATAPARPAPQKRGERDLMDGILHFEGLAAQRENQLADRVQDFPPDVQQALRWFVDVFELLPSAIPSKPVRGGKGGAFAQWIAELREINAVLDGYGRDAFLAVKNVCRDLSISHPGAIMWALPAEVGKMARKPAPQPEVIEDWRKSLIL